MNADPAIYERMVARLSRGQLGESRLDLVVRGFSEATAEVATEIRDEAVDRIRRQWADERRVYLALAEDVRLVDVKDDDEPDEDVDYGEVWKRIGRRLDAIARFEAGEDPTEANTDKEARLPL